MEKCFVSYVVDVRGYESNVKIWECESDKECIIKILDHFNELEEDFNEEDYSEEELEDILDVVQSENCGEWMITSIIRGEEVIYTS